MSYQNVTSKMSYQNVTSKTQHFKKLPPVLKYIHIKMVKMSSSCQTLANTSISSKKIRGVGDLVREKNV